MVGTRFCITCQSTGKRDADKQYYRYGSLSYTPGFILQEPNLLHLATAHANRLLHVHLH